MGLQGKFFPGDPQQSHPIPTPSLEPTLCAFQPRVQTPAFQGDYSITEGSGVEGSSLLAGGLLPSVATRHRVPSARAVHTATHKHTQPYTQPQPHTHKHTHTHNHISHDHTHNHTHTTTDTQPQTQPHTHHTHTHTATTPHTHTPGFKV